MYIHVTWDLAVHKEITKAGSVHVNKMNTWFSSLYILKLQDLKNVDLCYHCSTVLLDLVSIRTSFIHNMSTLISLSQKTSNFASITDHLK